MQIVWDKPPQEIETVLPKVSLQGAIVLEYISDPKRRKGIVEAFAAILLTCPEELRQQFKDALTSLQTAVSQDQH